MKIYAVGGAVRDKQLGLPVKDQDWVVVGTTQQQMLAQGFKQVGRDFPVFLHPKTHEEYALARTERKTALGYKGFEVFASPSVTLEEDLSRRDLTINAIAESPEGEVVDPFGGVEDLKNRRLRHVSPAFSEDPVRILRVARFAARFASFGFYIADETLTLMKSMVTSGEVDALVPERVWAEVVRALCEDKPSIFFEVLRQCGALKPLFPEVNSLYGVPQNAKYHPEVDTGIHTMMVLDRSAQLSSESTIRFAALVHDLGKGNTPKDILPKHSGHEERGVKLAKVLCKRLRVPREHRDLAILVTRYHTHCHRAEELKTSTLLKTIQALDAFRRPERFEEFLITCLADSQGRLGMEDQPYPQIEIFRQAYRAAAAVNTKEILEMGLQGQAFANKLWQRRIKAIKYALNGV
ncbi:MAG: multifunctional CCA addition/repair protein [Gammaproteobacteria bacterium]|nr:multifunctional CCA addition/repair protein [Gammaproteobacteria bacterium]